MILTCRPSTARWSCSYQFSLQAPDACIWPQTGLHDSHLQTPERCNQGIDIAAAVVLIQHHMRLITPHAAPQACRVKASQGTLQVPTACRSDTVSGLKGVNSRQAGSWGMLQPCMGHHHNRLGRWERVGTSSHCWVAAQAPEACRSSCGAELGRWDVALEVQPASQEARWHHPQVQVGQMTKGKPKQLTTEAASTSRQRIAHAIRVSSDERYLQRSCVQNQLHLPGLGPSGLRQHPGEP